jgi:hypothetical protein
MNWTMIASTVAGVVLGIGVVAKFIDKFMPKVAKYIAVAHQALGLLDDLVTALKDHVLTADEIAKLQADVEAIKTALKS